MQIFWIVILACLAQIVYSQPNIIVIIADDLGWNDVGFRGSNQIPTPNIDALGYNGIILNRHYTLPTCTPSRTAFLTGKYPIRYGFQGFPMAAGDPGFIPLDVPILPERLKELGYKNYLIGKWHVGSSYRKVTPTRRGFDYHFGYWNGYVDYFNYEISQFVPEVNVNMSGFDLHDNLSPAWDARGKYATDLFTEKAVGIINAHDISHPLFMVLSHLAPHTGRGGDQLEVPDREATDKKFGYIKDPQRRLYADIVNRLDESVGKVMEALSSRKLLHNSIVLFLSDNGAQTTGLHQNWGSNWPLRGLKFTLFEGGVRGTAVVFSPLFKNKGVTSNALLHITDWLPTFYAAAGGQVENLGDIDGINQLNSLIRNAKGSRNNLLLNIDEVHNVSALIGYDGRYKLINGTIVDSPFFNSTWDGYLGESGRGDENPPYNVTGILTSQTNTAIQQLPCQPKLNEQTILKIRAKTDVICKWPREVTNDCRKFCLYDLMEDPCETNDLSSTLSTKIIKNLKEQLTVYWEEFIPQRNRSVDIMANPVYFNNTWYPWLDQYQCI